MFPRTENALKYTFHALTNCISESAQTKTENTYNVINQLLTTRTSDLTITNEYNAEGLRTGKEVKSKGVDLTKKTNYTYEYDKVIFETDSFRRNEALSD